MSIAFVNCRKTGKRKTHEILFRGRVAKCHGYDGLIRVKMFAGWGKKFGSTCDLAKSSLFGKSYATCALFTCKNLPYLIDLSTFALQNHPFG